MSAASDTRGLIDTQRILLLNSTVRLINDIELEASFGFELIECDFLDGLVNLHIYRRLAHESPGSWNLNLYLITCVRPPSATTEWAKSNCRLLSLGIRLFLPNQPYQPRPKKPRYTPLQHHSSPSFQNLSKINTDLGMMSADYLTRI